MTMPARQLEIERRQKPLRVVRHRRSRRQMQQVRTKGRKKRINFTTISIGVLTILSMGLILIMMMGYNDIAVLNREVSSNTATLESLRAENDYLKMQMAPYVADARIEQLAKSRLKMAHPTDAQIMALTTGRETADGMAPASGRTASALSKLPKNTVSALVGR